MPELRGQVVLDGAPFGCEVTPDGGLRALPRRRRLWLAPLADVVGAAAAAGVVALGAAAAPAQAAALTFATFLLVGATVGRRSRWSAMLPFTRTLVALGAHAVAAVLVAVALDVVVAGHASPSVLALAAAVAAAITASIRRAAAPASTRVAVVGSTRSAAQLRRELLEAGVADREIVGVVAAGTAGDLPDPSRVPVLGELAMLDEVIDRHGIDLLLVGAEASEIEVFDRLADTCLHLQVRVCALTQFYEDALGHVPTTEIDSAWFRYIMHPRFRSADTPAKRTLDLIVVLIAGAAFLPVLMLCALLIKLHDGGPVLFRQRRIGAGGREFTLLKLRTMRTGPTVVRWSTADDERVTPIGRLLRRTHVDEVPQLINVLRGEMSVVGPRPEQPEFVGRLERQLPHYRRRHLIKPGLTGWAQVRCGYAGSDTGSAWKLCHDLFYLKHQSLGLDVAILAETVRALVADRQFPVSPETGLAAIAASGSAGQPVLSGRPVSPRTLSDVAGFRNRDAAGRRRQHVQGGGGGAAVAAWRGVDGVGSRVTGHGTRDQHASGDPGGRQRGAEAMTGPDEGQVAG